MMGPIMGSTQGFLQKDLELEAAKGMGTEMIWAMLEAFNKS